MRDTAHYYAFKLPDITNKYHILQINCGHNWRYSQFLKKIKPILGDQHFGTRPETVITSKNKHVIQTTCDIQLDEGKK